MKRWSDRVPPNTLRSRKPTLAITDVDRPRYEVVRSRRSTADIIIERDGRLLVRAPEWADDQQVDAIVDSRLYWIYQGLAEWRDLNATRVLREYQSGEGFLYLGRSYRLQLVSRQKEPLTLKDSRFRLRRDLLETGDLGPARDAFRAPDLTLLQRSVDRIVSAPIETIETLGGGSVRCMLADVFRPR